MISRRTLPIKPFPKNSEPGPVLVDADIRTAHSPLARKCRTTVQHTVVVNDCTNMTFDSNASSGKARTDGGSRPELDPVLGIGAREELVPDTDSRVPVLELLTGKVAHDAAVVVVEPHLSELPGHRVVAQNRVPAGWRRSI
uniref:Uncharacterized protein n=1 Tax=Mycena chlorophos TaxID=658473 RepID=A0ABQ0MCM0_MYCCL|nr:predicted protein [Mycena chlorophos]